MAHQYRLLRRIFERLIGSTDDPNLDMPSRLDVADGVGVDGKTWAEQEPDVVIIDMTAYRPPKQSELVATLRAVDQALFAYECSVETYGDRLSYPADFADPSIQTDDTLTIPAVREEYVDGGHAFKEAMPLGWHCALCGAAKNLHAGRDVEFVDDGLGDEFEAELVRYDQSRD